MKKIVYCIFITIFMLSCEHTADLQIMKTAEQKISTLRSVDDAERIAMDALHKFPAHSQTKSQTCMEHGWIFIPRTNHQLLHGYKQ